MALAFFSFAAVADPAPTELPSGGQVTNGSASIAVDGSHMDVNQASQNASFNWQTFNIGESAQVDFHQPSSSAVAVNRIADPNGSQIMGRLNANGQIYLINPNGVLFGQGSQVNVGGLVASTLDISDADAASDKRTFSSTANGDEGKIINQGTLTAADGGYVALLGGQVSNQGIIQARLGTVALAAGNKITLDFAGDKLLNVQVDKGALQALAENKQLIQADGGTVLMTAKAADALLSSVVNNEGVIEARTVEDSNGVIKLLGDMDSGTVNVGGTLDASALPSPSGGEGADGGFIETSAAHVKIADDALITTAAPNGKTGTWLIDPVDFTIAAGSGALSTSGIGASTLSNSLGSSNVAIATDAGTGGNGDIFVNSAVSWSANKLTLTAHRNIAINANLNGSGTASLALEYGQGAVAAGNTSTYTLSNGAQVSLPVGVNFSTKLGTDGATTNYTVITSLGLENSVTGTDLQGMYGTNTTNTANLAGNYVLGADIDASATSGWAGGFKPVGYSYFMDANNKAFSGKFDGLGHTISNLSISRSGGDFGLFGATDGAVLQNVGLLNVAISGGSNGGTGALVGRASNTAIRYSYVDGGNVSSSTLLVGGLAGAAIGSTSISYSYTNVSVAAGLGGAASNAWAGGLVGLNGGAISNSYATGSVSAPSGNAAANNIGGLVGLQNNGSISNSYATGLVTGNNTLGGLVGGVAGAPTVTNSYWDTQTTGQNSSAGGGTGKTTAQMQTQATFTGFDFTTTPVWRIYEGHTAPLLDSFLTPLTVTANNAASKTYDGLAYSGGNGVTYSSAPNANLLGSVSYGGTSQGAVNAGSYVITPSGQWSNQRGYDIAYANGALTVNTAPLTVTANAASKTYDGLANSGGNGVGYSGFVNSETSAVLGGALAYGGSSQGAVNAGSYAITPSGLTSSNYAITFANGSLTVNPAVLTITANGFSKTYDGLAYSGGNGAGYSGFVNGETSAVLGGALAYGGSSQGAVNAGSYAITPSGLTSGNYAISYTNGALTVNAAPLSITANNAAKVYDGLAWSGGNGVGYSGFVNGETSTVLGGALAYGGSSQGAVNAGSYAITLSGLTSSNYAITYAAASLSITPATLTYTAAPAIFFSGQTPYGLSGTVTGFMAGDTLAGSTTGLLAWTTSANATSQPGQYSITGSGLSATNYVFAQAAGNATALTLIDSRPVENAVAQLESTILLPSANNQPETSGSVAENSSSETSSPESVNNAVQNNTKLSSTTTIGENGPTFKIVHPGVKLPDYMVDVNE
jgi:filamentous hemagglutinin family protein